MSTRGDILRRAAQVEPDAVPEPWRPSDDEDALATVSDREHYRKNLVTLSDGAGEVPAYVWDFPRTPTIPDEVREEWTRGSAGRVLGPNGKFVSRGSDVPRLSHDGEDPGLLVEAAGRTNHVLYSSDASQWGVSGGSVGTAVPSIIDGENAYEVSSSGESSDGIRQSAGTFTSNDEIAVAIIENGNGGKFQLRVFDTTTSSAIAIGNYVWSTGEALLGSIGAEKEVNARTLTTSGPNGNEVIILVLRYDPSNLGAGGNDRDHRHLADVTESGGSFYHHHAQIEEAPNASSPIVTGGSPVTRAGDEYAIFEGGQPEWWNPNEGTIIADVTISAISGTVTLLADPTQGSGGFVGIFVGLQEQNGGQYRAEIQDGSSFGIESPSATEPTNRITIAASFTTSKKRISLKGEADTGSANGSLPKADDLSLRTRGAGPTLYHSVKYIPRALPESTLNAITA